MNETASVLDLPLAALLASGRGRAAICDPDLSVCEAVRAMEDSGSSAVLVRSEGGLGIVTDHDLRSLLVGAEVSADAPVARVMSAPAFTLGEDATGTECLLAMLDRGIRHVPVVSEAGEVLGIVADTDLLAAEAQAPLILRKAIARADGIAELRGAAELVRASVISLHRAGLDAHHVARALTASIDALVGRTIELSTSAAGNPPAFSWLALGSHGRGEVVPSSDLDSGVVWPDSLAEEAEAVRSVASEVVETLDAIGWRPDAHGISASSVAARSAADWRLALDRWVEDPTGGVNLVSLSILLDARSVHGPEDTFGLGDALRRVGRRRAIPRLLQRLALAERPPTGFLRDIVVERSGEHRGELDIKRGGLLPIVCIARYAGVAAEAEATSTSERIRAGAAAGSLDDGDATALEEAFELFARVRLEHQVRQLESGLAPDNFVDPKALNALARRFLGDAFREVASVQERLAAEVRWDL